MRTNGHASQALLPPFQEWQPGPWRLTPVSLDMDPKVNPIILRTAAELAISRGLDVAHLWDDLGFSLQDIHEPACLLRYTQASEALRRLALAMQEPNLGFLIGQQHQLVSLGLVGLGVMASPTLGDAIAFGLRHQKEAGSMLKLRLKQSATELSLIASPILCDLSIERILVECTFTSLLLECEQILGHRPQFKLVELVSPPLAHPDFYRDAFGCPVLFGQAHNRLVADPALLHHVIGDANMASMLFATQLLAHGQSDLNPLAQHIESILIDDIRQPPTMLALAERFNLSERTLRRRLQQEGQSYQDLVDMVRRSRALEMLVLAQRPLLEVARELGLPNVRNLSIALKRWTDHSRVGN